MKVLTIGGAMQDIFLEYKAQTALIDNENYIVLPEGRKITVDELNFVTGGGASNSAASFAHLGFEVKVACSIGADAAANFILHEFQALGISTQLIQKNPDRHTGTSFIIPTPSGDRAILVHRGATELLQLDKITDSDLADVGQIYITSLGPQTSTELARFAKRAKQKTIKISCNPGTSQLTARVDTLLDALPHIDVLILNHFESELLLRGMQKSISSSPEQHLVIYFHEIHARGPKIAVVTDGASGVYASDGKNIYYHQALKFTPVSTVGAGDAFGSTFTAYLALGKSVEQAIQAGIINAASALKHVGAKIGLLNYDQIEEQRRELDPALLKIFTL